MKVDTSGVEPMYTTLENESLRLREDVVSDGNRRYGDLIRALAMTLTFRIADPHISHLKTRGARQRQRS